MMFVKIALQRFRFFLIILFCILMSGSAYCQLMNFNATAVVTDEGCAGAGGVSFDVTNATPGADFLYTIYSLPGMEVEYSGSDPVYNGLISGNYSAIISQSLGNESNTVTLDFIVADATAGVVYTLQALSENCSGGNSIVVNVVSGNAVGYEIISGPVIIPTQSSNIFTGLTSGTYNIRVYDECGQGIVTTFTALFQPQAPVFDVPDFESPDATGCDTTTLVNSMSYPPGTIISYPLTVQYVIHASDGSPDIINTQIFTTGAPSIIEFSYDFIFTPGVTYTYDIIVTNGCGVTFGPTGLAVNILPQVSLVKKLLPCEEYYFNLVATGFNPPYTVNFTSPATGFNPADYNTQYPGPFTDATIAFGGEGMPVPEGTYTATITDSCNRTSAPFTLQIEEQVVVPVGSGRNNGCFSDFGRITISVPDRKVVSAVITAAPPAYTETLPHDVSSFINAAGTLVVTNLPLGTYFFTITDSCGDVYTNVQVTIPPYQPKGFSANALADCTIGIGAVGVSSGNGNLVSMTMTAAPVGFEEPLPYDVTGLIDPSNGDVFIDNLPAGDYTFTGADGCGVTDTVSVTVTGYQPDLGETFTFVSLCNSFNVDLKDDDISSLTPTYWLQKQNPDNAEQWGHPETGVPYTEGELPNTTNSVLLLNGQINYNLQYFGTFRVLKAFESAGNATAEKICTEVLGDPFSYDYRINIDNIYKIDCASNPNDVYVDASGLAPLRYYALNPVTGAVIVNNGTNSIFSNLPPGTYAFQVEDDCGQLVREIANISMLPDLVDAQVPDNIAYCAPAGQSLFQAIDLTRQNTAILGGVSPSLYSITYYTSQAEADAGINAIADPEQFVNTSNPQTIYARMEQVYVMVCPEVISFEVEVGESPVISVDETQYLCEERGFLTLDAGSGYDSYLWSPTGETTQTITITEPGDYSVEVRYVNALTSCPVEANIAVIAVPIPEILGIETADWTYNTNSFTVIIENPSLYEYSLDNINFQQSNTFTDLPPGIYTVYVRDLQGCTTVSKRLHLLYYPNFFTPNGDGENETWRIEFSTAEPELIVYVYDRYGKLITNFGPQDQGWDGTFNGNPLPATDYWFVVERADGQIHKGHFSLLR